MRKINFKVRNIGSEKYLSYVLDDDCDFDEELLDYLDDNNIVELIDIIYEEDDENDYLTYNVTDRTTVESLLSNTVNAEMMLSVIRGVASGIVNMRDLGIPVSYVVLHRAFTYVNPVTYDVKMICVPVETDTNINSEFKFFVKQLITDVTYSDDEDCNYVARIINMLNVEKFSIRTFLGQITELMESAGMQIDDVYMDVDGSGVEVSQVADGTQPDTTMDDLPDVGDVSFDDEDDGLDMYDEEPAESNTIFKDLDLDTEESKSDGINMDVFDDSMLQELEIDEEEDEEQEAYAAAESDFAEDVEGLTEALTSDALAEDFTPTDLDEQQNGESINITEIAKTAEGVTEIEPDVHASEKPILIDTEDLDNLIDAPPVVKNIRINRAKIIQKVASEAEDEVVENPTEQIVGSAYTDSESVEPETLMDPVKQDSQKPETGSTSTGSTVELTAGMNVVKDAEPEVEKKTAPGVPKAMPYIVRVNTGERVMINKAVFKLGKSARGVDFSISGNGAISRVHAIIYQREEGCFLKDNKATNATYVNGEKLDENQEMLLKNDSTITLGGEDFIFKLS
ncbi:MAG: FHA domain-containing protein [Coprococcus sp.]|nr:FHA domain-containing protein [Coprococcus sp.]